MSAVQFLDTRLNVPIDARRVIQLTNTIPSLTETEAQEWINTFLLNSQNRAVINLRNTYFLTDHILHQNNAAASNVLSLWVTLRSIRIDSISTIIIPATLRIYYEYRRSATGVGSSEFRILRDTTQIGNVVSTTLDSWQPMTIDVTDCVNNTIIHIQSRDLSGLIIAQIQNFRILGQNHVILTLAEAINRRTAGGTIAFTNTL